MADTLQTIFRGLNAVSTVGQARTAIGEALTAIGQAHGFEGIKPAQRAVLESARLPLQSWYAEIEDLNGNQAYKTQFAARRRLVERAYIEIAGITGEVNARRTVSLVNEIQQGVRDTARAGAEGLRAVATEVGAAAGGAAGGIIGGLGPVALAIVGLVVYLAMKARA